MEVNIMRVNESSVELKASSYQRKVEKETSSLQVWDHRDAKTKEVGPGDQLELSEEELLLSEEDELKLRLIELFIEKLTKKEFRFTRVAFYSPRAINLDIREMEQEQPIDRKPQPRPKEAGWGIRYHHSKESLRQQKMSFKAKGTVKLEDGREIEIDYNLHMSEEFYSKRSETLLAGDALIDPIVINYKGPGKGLTKEKYAFDLDMDGTKDQISFVAPGSGFLSYDKNGNGIIDDGGELFGPATNDGFMELAAYDEDGNGWIDEGDEIFSQLRIWEKDSTGEDHLISLGEAGVGAIYLKNVNTGFDYHDDDQKLQGKMRKSSIFLREDGTSGSVHEIDLVV